MKALTDADLKRALDDAGALTTLALGFAVALADLGDFDLPAGSEARVDQAQMRALASLYLAADLEAAGVLPAVETLAGLARSGAIPGDIGPAAPLLQAFWRGRNERASADERSAFYGRLFGAGAGPVAAVGANMEFEDRMLDLCEALFKLDELASNSTYGGVGQQARVRAAAQRLAGNLVDAGGGVTAFFAQEILQSLRDALAILATPAVRATLRARDTWEAIAGVNRLSGERTEDPSPFARRGKAGMMVISWLADAAPMLAQPSQPLVGLGDPVIAAAVEWLEASLAIGETAPAPVPPTSPRAPQAASPWAAIGA
ncbi:hypothetical protein [Phenylobacterium sp. LjRoot225]|uniref:hypothetical protein n=1 Tax=Phenylobacterium sp. LjRoot225 TaxID=3342285 RepID=UPI003F4FF1DB